MCYRRAKEVLPDEIIELIQEYVQGEYLYIPIKEGKSVTWGTKNNTRNELEKRNHNIYKEYMVGVSKDQLAQKYFLSKKSIDRIILNIKSNC